MGNSVAGFPDFSLQSKEGRGQKLLMTYFNERSCDGLVTDTCDSTHLETSEDMNSPFLKTFKSYIYFWK